MAVLAAVLHVLYPPGDPWGQQTTSLKQASLLCALHNVIVLPPAKLPCLKGTLKTTFSCLQEKLVQIDYFYYYYYFAYFLPFLSILSSTILV